jgi:hypothetical protein
LDICWKLHRIENKKDHRVTRELHDLWADPKEANNLADKEPARLAAMKRQLQPWLKSVAARFNVEDYSR